MHLFAIPDELSTPEDTGGLLYIGKIELQEHVSARNMWAAPKEVGLLIYPFEDTRLTFDGVTALQVIAEETYANHHFTEILTRAIQQKAGIVSFCD